MLSANAKIRIELPGPDRIGKLGPGKPSLPKELLYRRPNVNKDPELPSQYIAINLGYLRLPAELPSRRKHSLASPS